MSDLFGYTTTDSTSKKISVIAAPSENLVSIVGKMVSLDIQVEKDTYRCLGTITDIKTINSSFSPQVEMLSTKHPDLPKSDDLRKLEFSIQATFQKPENSNSWIKYSSVLPTSPDTLQPVHILDETHVLELLTNETGEEETYPTVGFFRGMGTAPQPLNIPDFGGDTGSAHAAVIGKSGSGKDLALTTRIPTPTGWTTMKDIKVGSYVLSEKGEPIQVLKVHEILRNSTCYEVTFSDGSTIIAGSGHLWYTETPVTSSTPTKPLLTSTVISSLRKLADDNVSSPNVPQITAVFNVIKVIKNLQTVDDMLLAELIHTVEAQLTPTEASPVQYSASEYYNKVASVGSQVIIQTHNSFVQGSVKTTQEIIDTLNDEKGLPLHSIPLSKAINLPQRILPVNPYVLGVWLTNGDSNTGVLTNLTPELKGVLENQKAKLVSQNPETEMEEQVWNVARLKSSLKKIGLINHKHIPVKYLRSSIEQRKKLLAGLLDTAGEVAEDGSIEYFTERTHILNEVKELILSLGYQVTMQEKKVKVKNRTLTRSVINFVTDDEIFNLPSKEASHQSLKSLNVVPTHRQITSIKAVDTVPTRCITVDSPTALYLAGETFIPTHNTAMYTYMLAAAMKHEQHAVMVIDPQGQWANENGMVMSTQKFAKGLGRDVSVLRVAEDIKLPMSEDVFSRMVLTLNLWKKFRRMGKENQEAFSDAVAAKIANLKNSEYDKDPRTLLSKIFTDIAYSSSALDRIYVKGDRQDGFRRDLLLLAGEPIIDPETEEQELITESDKEDIEQNWNSILSVFTPLINLFSSKNIEGGRRTPMDGDYGFLKNIFQIRNAQSSPAPYVVLDMSPSVKLQAKASLLQGANASVNMQAVLDNQEVKALIILLLLDEMKKASELAFSMGGGNLNTQIVFDEAWRYAPEGKADPVIEELASKLEGFALDTRKFGIGWTYILQSPGDLKTGIWRQLSYVYVGYGLVGDDVRKLESLTDDVRQIDLYRQFIPPKSTKIYPFMLMGPISPVIFTTAPAFVNIFNKTEDFLFYNNEWIQNITETRSLPKLTIDYLKQTRTSAPNLELPTEKKSYTVGKGSNHTKSKPQTATVLPELPVEPEDTTGLIEEMPF